MESDNPIRRLRRALGMNQPDFGRLIGRSHQSIAVYERGKEVPKDVIDSLKTLAAQRGLADIALELSSEEWKVRHIVHPGEKLISAPRQRRRQDGHQAWHQMLDAILNSGNARAIEAVQSNLIVFADYVEPSTAVLPTKVPTVPAQKKKNA